MSQRHGACVRTVDIAVRSESECWRTRAYGQRIFESILVGYAHVVTVTVRLRTDWTLLTPDAAVGARARSEVVAASLANDDPLRHTRRAEDGTATASGRAHLPTRRGCAAFTALGAR